MPNSQDNVMRIRSYDMQDAGKLLNLLVAFDNEENHHGNANAGHLENEAFDLERVLHELKQGKNSWALVSDYRGNLTGFCCFHRFTNDADTYRKANTYELSSYYVDPRFRRKDIGTKLVGSSLGMMRRLKTKKCCTVITEIRDDNHESIQLQRKKFGFRKMAQRGGYYRSDHSVYMRKI
jgi:ribosomal protein S18 acetylase RimI-like enzyme